MAIVPQISSVQPNTEVVSTSSGIQGVLTVNSDISDIQTFIDETSAGSSTQITFQQGTYSASGQLEISSNAYVVIMNGAFLPDVDFVDTNGDPSTNVIDLNVLAANNTGAGVVFNIEVDETLEVGQSFSSLTKGGITSGASKIGVALDQNQNEILLNSRLNDSTDAGDFATVGLDVNSIVVRQLGPSLESLQFGPHEVLYSNDTPTFTNVSIGSDSILARQGTSGMSSLSVDEDEMIVRLSGENIKSIALNDDTLHDALDLRANDIRNGTFKSTTGTYLFDTIVQVDGFFRSTGGARFTGDVEAAANLEVGSELATPRIFSNATATEIEIINRLEFDVGGEFELDVTDNIFIRSSGTLGKSLQLKSLSTGGSFTEVDITNTSIDIQFFPLGDNYNNSNITPYYEINDNRLTAYSRDVTFSGGSAFNNYSGQALYTPRIETTRTGVMVFPVFEDGALADNVPGTTDTSIQNGGVRPPDGHISIGFQINSNGRLVLTVVTDDGSEFGNEIT